MCISYLVKSRIHSLVHFWPLTYRTRRTFQVYLHVENDLFRARLSGLKVGEPFIDFVQPPIP